LNLVQNVSNFKPHATCSTGIRTFTGIQFVPVMSLFKYLSIQIKSMNTFLTAYIASN
jgi:hypothetical protein